MHAIGSANDPAAGIFRLTDGFTMTISLLGLVASGMSIPAIDDEHFPFLSSVFGDHMVLQRNKRNTFWGWTKPGDRVKVSIAGKSTSCVAGNDGKWVAKLTPPAVGGPYTVVISGPRRVELQDVLVGDVWLCTGQSNMELGLAMALNGKADVAAADEPNIRLCMAPRQIGFTPRPVNDAPWRICSPKSVGKGGWGGFSAVGYYFGRALQHQLKVPIGLMEIAWGGTSAEAWTSAEALRPLGDFDLELDQLEALNRAEASPIGTYIDLWMTQNDPGYQKNWQIADLVSTDWQATTLPDGFSDIGFSGKKGVAWFRKEIDLPNPPTNSRATLSLGRVQSYDTVWVNGVQIGSTNGPGVRKYSFWSSVLKPGKNLVAVKVFNIRGKGGFTSAADAIVLDAGDGKQIPLSGDWWGKVGAEITLDGRSPKDTEPNPTIPTVLMNGMIAPVAPLAIRGVIWYQGETNSGRSYQYRRLLPAMIADWRRMFGQGDFPFYIVSLAAFMPQPKLPGDDGWAELREAQAMTASHVRHSGLVITTDIGSATDVHPKDKKTVGERLALVALANEFHENVPFSGPLYRRMKTEGSNLRVWFDHTDQGLVAKGGDLTGFAIAGADQKWHWADARIDGDSIVVSCKEVPSPVAVRYAWAANPACNLFNGAGLPAAPFRSDDWKGVTYSKK